MFSLFFTYYGGIMKTVKECKECKKRFVYWCFEDNSNICCFCKPKEEKDDIQSS